jgi:hypothetical protein
MQMLKKLHLSVNLFNLRDPVYTSLTKRILTKNIRHIFYISLYGEALENCEKRLSASSYMWSCPSVKKENLGSHNKNFREI